MVDLTADRNINMGRYISGRYVTDTKAWDFSPVHNKQKQNKKHGGENKTGSPHKATTKKTWEFPATNTRKNRGSKKTRVHSNKKARVFIKNREHGTIPKCKTWELTEVICRQVL